MVLKEMRASMTPRNTHTASAIRTVLHIATAIAALILIGVIIWLDVFTSIWQDMVILSGLAAGFVSFLLTTVFVNRFLQRQLEARWAPVTHMALTSILHQLADEEHSDLSRGEITPRTLSVPTATDQHKLKRELAQLRKQVLKEQNHLSGVLGTWSNFLTSTGDNTDILRSAAELALQLDQVRDVALEVERYIDATATAQPDLGGLVTQINSCNQHHVTLISTLEERKREDAGSRALHKK